jgi:hypothetical protein
VFGSAARDTSGDMVYTDLGAADAGHVSHRARTRSRMQLNLPPLDPYLTSRPAAPRGERAGRAQGPDQHTGAEHARDLTRGGGAFVVCSELVAVGDPPGGRVRHERARAESRVGEGTAVKPLRCRTRRGSRYSRSSNAGRAAACAPSTPARSPAWRDATSHGTAPPPTRGTRPRAGCTSWCKNAAGRWRSQRLVNGALRKCALRSGGGSGPPFRQNLA